ncbi:TasA family protein [Modestobacter sp. VKM Ac-2986]|uniref:TasA family protein n=1 Tax=Modestobacter sp. VKM Ac-2986 TaxID=3004140 RepID=UPI0022AADB49|nr:TasA family protein [Modestobacter sp. VKM Ac-2986]MCZ2828744.1 TasA family protein [Modestobacter sp. VKM Ac-2986]
MTAATTTATRSRNVRKVLGSLGVIGAAAAVAGMGTFGSFTDSTTPLAASVTSGTLSLDLAGLNENLSISAANLVPGDSVATRFNLENSGTVDMAAIGLGVTASPSSVLDTDKVNGLKLAIDSCSVSWTVAPNNTFTCAGTTKSVLAPTAATSTTTLANLNSLAAGKSDNLVVKLSLPEAAGNEFQGKTSTLSLVFTGTQKTGTTR